MKIFNEIKSVWFEVAGHLKIWWITGHKAPFERKAHGYLFNLKPGERIKITYQDFKMIRNTVMICIFFYLIPYKPTDTVEMWAHKQALQRIIKRGIDIEDTKEDLSQYFNMDVDELIRLWNEHPIPPDQTYIIEYPIKGLERYDWPQRIFYDLPAYIRTTACKLARINNSS